MTVTDKQVAALKAQLAGKLDEHKKLFRDLDWRSEGPAYTALLDAAFFEAVDRRFGAGNTPEDAVIRYVADLRSRTDQAADSVDPHVAERLILKVLGHGSAQDLDATEATTAKQFILVSLIVDEQFDDSALNAFLASARKLASQWLS